MRPQVRAVAPRPALALAAALVIGAALAPSSAAPPVSSSAVPPPPEAMLPRRGPVAFAGMTLEVRGGRLVIAAVAPGSPAGEAALLSLDVVLAVDDVALVDLETISPERALDLFRRAGGGDIALTIGRGASTRRVHLSRDAALPALPSDPVPLLPGAPAPDFEGRDLTGGAFALRDLRGKIVLIDFWASSCPPCRGAAIPLKRIADQYGDGLAIVGVSLDEDRQTYEAFAWNHRLPGRQIRDGGGWFGPIARRYDVASTGIPFFVLLDRRGRVAGTATRLADLEERIARLAGSDR
jgi:thiol-disulfide isomerase/thioredoxin